MKVKKAKRKRKRKRKNRPILRGIGCVVLELCDNIRGPLMKNTVNNDKLLELVRNIKEGDFSIEQTIEFPFRVGDRVTGIGAGQYIPPNKHYRGHTTNLIWEGTGDNSPLFHFPGCGIIVEKVTFIDAPIGILLAQTKKGLGTGKMVVRDCYFDSCGVAFEAGYKMTDHNNDCVVLDHVIADDCESLLRLRNAQAMGYSLRDCVARGSQTADIIDVFGGGCVYADNLKVIHGKSVLRLRSREAAGGGGGKSGIGSSNGLYTLRNIKLDEHAECCKIVQMDDFYPVNIDVENVQAPASPWNDNPGSPMYELNGNVVITIRNSNLYKHCITWKDKKRRGPDDIPNILIDRCRFNGDDIFDVFSKDNSSGKCYFKAINCSTLSGTPIDNFSGYIEV